MTSKSGASNLASTSPISRLFSLMPHNVVNAYGVMQRRLLRYPERLADQITEAKVNQTLFNQLTQSALALHETAKIKTVEVHITNKLIGWHPPKELNITACSAKHRLWYRPSVVDGLSLHPDDAYALVIRVADELGVKEKLKGKYYACTADGWSSDPFDDPIEAARAYRQRVVSVELAHLQPQPLAPGLEICTGPRCFHILEVGDHIVECVHFILMDRTNVDTGIACNAAVMSLPNPFLTTP